jgi:hypothetical protein
MVGMAIELFNFLYFEFIAKLLEREPLSFQQPQLKSAALFLLTIRAIHEQQLQEFSLFRIKLPLLR